MNYTIESQSGDIFALSLDTAGNLLELGIWATEELEYAMAADVDGDDAIVMTGRLYESLDLDLGPAEYYIPNPGPGDDFMLRSGLPQALTGISSQVQGATVVECFPNPCTRGAVLSIALDNNSGEGVAMVLDASGRHIASVGFSGNLLQLNTSVLSCGTYLVRLSTQSGMLNTTVCIVE